MRKFLLKRHRLALALLMLFAAFTQTRADDNVAEIGDTKYATLQAAIDAAKGSDKIVTLINNVTADKIIRVYDGFTLDLAGYSITGKGDVKGEYTEAYQTMFLVNIASTSSHKKFTVEDSKGSGSIKLSDDTSKPLRLFLCTNYAQLCLSGVNASVENTSTTGTATALELRSYSSLSLENAAISATAYGNAIGVNATSLDATSTEDFVVMASGSIKVESTKGIASGILGYRNVNVSGGTITAKSATSAYGIRSYAATSLSGSAEITINSKDNTGYCLTVENNGSFAMSGGSLTAGSLDNYSGHGIYVYKDAKASTITDGKIKVKSGSRIIGNASAQGTLTVTGGYYSATTVSSNLGEGYSEYSMGLDTKEYKEGYLYYVGTEDKNIARISDTNKKFFTLQGAFDAVGNDSTIILLKDASGDGVILYGKDAKTVTLYLNNHTYTVDGQAVGSRDYETQGFHFEKGWNITVKNGTLTATSPKVVFLIQNYSNLSLQNVTLDESNNSRTKYVISNNFGSLTTTGNTVIKAAEGNVAFDVYYGLSASYDEGINVKIGNGTAIKGIVQYDKDSRIKTEDWTEKAVIEVADNVDLSDVTFENEGNSKVTPNVKTSSGSSLVVAKIGSKYYPSLESAVTNATSGATINILKSGTYSIPAIPTTLTIDGSLADGTVIINEVSEQTATSNYPLFLKGLTFSSESALSFKAVNNINAENCTFTSPVDVNSGYRFYNCTFNQSNSDTYSVQLNSGNGSFEKSIFNCKNGIAIKYNETTSTKSKTTIQNCTFTSEESNTNAAVMLYVADNSTVSSTITLSGINTVSNFSASNSDIKTKADNGLWGVNATTSTTASIIKDGETYFPATSNDYIAEVNGTQYKYLGEAFDAVEDGGTVKIVATATTTLNKTLGSKSDSKTFTLDLNGQELQLVRLVAFDNITITDNSKEKNGKLLLSSSSFTVTPQLFVNGKLTVENGTITSSGASPICVAKTGDVTIKGGAISYTGTYSSTYSVSVKSNGKLSITGGLFSDNSAKDYLAANYGFSETTIDGTTWYEVVPTAIYYTTTKDGDKTFLTGNDIAITDGSYYSFIVPKDVDGKNVTYRRTFKNTTWNCWYMPFDIDATAYSSDVKFYQIYSNGLDDNNQWVFTVKEVLSGTILANTPYFVKPLVAKDVSFNVKDATLFSTDSETRPAQVVNTETTSEKFTYTGIYVKKVPTEDDLDWYVLTNNGKFSKRNKAEERQALNPFRFYLTISSIDGSPYSAAASGGSKLFSIQEVDDDNLTGINSATQTAADDDNAVIYNLQGQRVTNPSKGIYIINGKKVIIK